MKFKWTTASSLASLSAILIVGAASDVVNSSQKQTSRETVKTARVVANGDSFIHKVHYASAQKTDGSYGFNP